MHNSAQRSRVRPTRIRQIEIRQLTFLDQFANFNARQNNWLYGIYGGLAHDQKAAMQQTFHVAFTSLYFAHSYTKHLPSRSEATPYDIGVTTLYLLACYIQLQMLFKVTFTALLANLDKLQVRKALNVCPYA